MEEVGRKMHGSSFISEDLVQGLKFGGNIVEYDGAKVAAILEDHGRIDHGKFQNVMERAF